MSWVIIYIKYTIFFCQSCRIIACKLKSREHIHEHDEKDVICDDAVFLIVFYTSVIFILLQLHLQDK